MANSFPKSGTHLLTQILAALPGSRIYGTFLASMPSITFRERSSRSTISAIRSMVPQELVSAHLFHHESYAEALIAKNAIHFFIYRDPRDVAVSEAHYLATMNRWHGLHRYFKALPTLEERIELSILGIKKPGFPYDYPDIAARFRRYSAWLDDPLVCPVRFEDLVGESRHSTVRKLFEFAKGAGDMAFDVESTVQSALENVDPGRSPTFRQGSVGGWREVMSPQNQASMKKAAGGLLVSLGYETTEDW